jgi:hypothetical protein
MWICKTSLAFLEASEWQTKAFPGIKDIEARNINKIPFNNPGAEFIYAIMMMSNLSDQDVFVVVNLISIH